MTFASLTNRTRILLLGLLIAAAFFNVTQNDLIGDDKALFTQNSFYKSPDNFYKIFTRQLVMNPGELTSSGKNGEESFSGCISYRPVSAATFFVDYAIWKGNSAGHHITNIILHFLAVVLVFYFLEKLVINSSVAFIGAALFAVSPIQSELINSVSYRSDLLSAIFYLAAILSYWQYRVTFAYEKEKWIVLPVVMYFLALFSKESALTFPLVIFILDRFFISCSKRRLNDPKLLFVFIAAVTVFYLYVYFVLMPNPVYLQNAPHALSGIEKVAVLLKIFLIYVVSLFVPSQVSILPPLYAPGVNPVVWWEIFVPLSVILFSLVLAKYFYHRNKVVTFAILWFFITYVPVSGIVPLLNPLAYRFLYLPSVGFFLAVAVGLEYLRGRLKQKQLSPNLDRILLGCLIGLCIALTLSLNSFFRSDLVACREMLRRYPDSSRPYWILGLEYYRAGNFAESTKYLQKHLTIPVNNPFISDDKEKFMTYHLLGLASQDPDAAILYLKKAALLYPDFVLLNLDLAKNYLAKRDFKTALDYAEKAVLRDPGLSLAYVYVVHIDIEMGQLKKARVILEKAKKLFGSTPQLKAVEHYLESKEGMSP